MLGKLSSVKILVTNLRKRKIDNFVVTELEQGKTRRWVVGWSFHPQRPPPSASSYNAFSLMDYMPYYPERSLSIISQEGLQDRVVDLLTRNKVQWDLSSDETELRGYAAGNTWSRSYRRTVAKQTMQNGEWAARTFAFTIRLPHVSKAGTAAECKLTIAWDFGHDHVLFESFCTMLRKGLQSLGSAK